MFASFINQATKSILLFVVATLFVLGAAPAYTQAVELTEEQKTQLIELLKVELQKIIAEKIAANGTVDLGPDFQYTLSVGSRDASTNGEVTRLQKYLYSQGVYPENLVTGYFGEKTKEAVERLETKYQVVVGVPGEFSNIDFRAIQEYGSQGLDERLVERVFLVESGQMELVFGWEAASRDRSLVLGELLDMLIKVNEDGSTGVGILNQYLLNSHGSANFESVIETISIYNNDGSETTYRGFTEADEDNFIIELFGIDKNFYFDQVGEWLKLKDEDDSDEVTFQSLHSFGQAVELNKEYRYFYIDYRSRVLDEEKTAEVGENIYKYNIVISIEDLFALVESEIDERYVERYLNLHGYTSVNDFKSQITEMGGTVWVNEEGLFVEYGAVVKTYDREAADDEFGDRAYLVNYTLESKPISLDLTPPSKYKIER